jgi:hypothetical protein
MAPQEQPAADPSTAIASFMFTREQAISAEQPPPTMMSPDPTGTLSSSNGMEDSPQWDPEYLAVVSEQQQHHQQQQPHQQHLMEATQDGMQTDYSSLVQGWEMQVPMDYWDLDPQLGLEPSGEPCFVCGLTVANRYLQRQDPTYSACKQRLHRQKTQKYLASSPSPASEPRPMGSQ